LELGDRLRQRRKERGLIAAELARQAEISKGYLSEIESGQVSRPSGTVLFRVATALGTSIADLLDKEIQPESGRVNSGLLELAEMENLPEGDVQMLAQIRFRGDQPQTVEDWRFLYESIKRSIASGN